MRYATDRHHRIMEQIERPKAAYMVQLLLDLSSSSGSLCHLSDELVLVEFQAGGLAVWKSYSASVASKTWAKDPMFFTLNLVVMIL